MAVSTDYGMSMLYSGNLRCRASTNDSRSGKWNHVRFCNGDFIGKKMCFARSSQGHGFRAEGCKGRVRMSLTADIIGESKLRDLEMEKRDTRTFVAIILGGGAGTRLYPLTKRRTKPAGMSADQRCSQTNRHANEQLHQQRDHKVYILAQSNLASLNRHLARAYNFGSGVTFGDGYVEVLAATQTLGEADKKWFQGTTDAVWQFHWLFEDARSKENDVLILSGNHLYRMVYMDFVQNHRQRGADITSLVCP